MNLIGIKRPSDRIERIKIYNSLVKLGLKQHPSYALEGYIIVDPEGKFYSVSSEKFYQYTLKAGCTVSEAKNKEEFLKLAKLFFKK